MTLWLQSPTQTDFRCPACDVCFISWPALRSHNRVKHGFDRPLLFVCHVCQKPFHDVRAHLNHLADAHGVRPLAELAPTYSTTPRNQTILLARISPALAHFARVRSLVCHWCSVPVRLDVPVTHPHAPSREHLVPRSRGGANHPENLVLAHRSCNSRRGSLVDPDEIARALET